VASVVVTPGATTFTALGQTARFTALARDQYGKDFPDTNFVWATSNATVASLGSAPVVTAMANGQATITATLNAVAGSATVIVGQTSSKLAFVAQPALTQAGVTMAALRVAVRDALDNAIATASDVVTIALAPNTSGATGATLSGTRTTNAVAGIASFTNLAIDRAGTYALVATSGNLTAATSSSFDIITNPARFDSLKLNTNTIAIGGLSVLYSAWATNASGRTLNTAGVQAYIEQGSVSRAAGGTLVNNCGSAVGTFPPGSCRIAFTIGASNSGSGSGTLVPGSATARFDLFEASKIYDTFRAPITLETFVPPPTPSARIDAVTLSSSTLTIGGAQATYTATITNASQGTVSNVAFQGYVTQGTASRAAGGFVINCVNGALGMFPPGSCNVNFTLGASNSAGGTGTLVPGAATAKFELLWDYGVLATFSLPITLVN